MRKPSLKPHRRLRLTPFNICSEPYGTSSQDALSLAWNVRAKRMFFGQCTSCFGAVGVMILPEGDPQRRERWVEHQPFGYCYAGAFIASLFAKYALMLARDRAKPSQLIDLTWSRTPRFAWQNPVIPCWTYEGDIETNLPLLLDLLPELRESHLQPDLGIDWAARVPGSDWFLRLVEK